MLTTRSEVHGQGVGGVLVESKKSHHLIFISGDCDSPPGLISLVTIFSRMGLSSILRRPLKACVSMI